MTGDAMAGGVTCSRGFRAVVLSAGGANACTGPPGAADTVTTAELVAGHLGCEPAAEAAIMTTDTRPKTATVTSGDVTVSGMAKGAGMLAPGVTGAASEPHAVTADYLHENSAYSS